MQISQVLWKQSISLMYLLFVCLIKTQLSKKFEVSGIPTLVFLDGNTGKMLTKDGRSIVVEDPDGSDFPWKPKTLVDIMSNCNLVDKEGKMVKWNEIDDDTVLGMYFSAHWVSGCGTSIVCLLLPGMSGC